MDLDKLATLKRQYLAAMSVEMKTPIHMILGASNELSQDNEEKANRIQEAAKYLLALVDELSEMTQLTT